MKYQNLYDAVTELGGFTAKFDEEVEHKSGFAYSLINHQLKMPRAFLYNRSLFNAICDIYSREAAFEGCYYGAWVENENVFFDLTKVVFNAKHAFDMARENGQRAVYDFEQKQSRYLDQPLDWPEFNTLVGV